MNNFCKKITNGELRLLAIVFSMVLLSATNVFAADGDLDATFDGDGKVFTNGFDNDEDNGGRDLVIQPDGKIVTIGSKLQGAFRLVAVARYNPNGSLDASFGTNGVATANFVTTQMAAVVPVVVDLQTDGKILIAGTGGRLGTDFGIVRFNQNGTLDTTFGNAGLVLTNVSSVTDTPFNDTLTSLVFDQTQNKIYAAGFVRLLQPSPTSPLQGFAVVRYNLDGSLDATFNGTGKKVFPVSGSNNSSLDGAIGEIALQTDGKLIAAGSTYTFNTGEPRIDYFAVARINLDGSLDSSFGNAGFALTNFPSNFGTFFSAAATTVSILPSGKIFVGGVSDSAGGSRYTAAQYNPNGSPDATFGTGGKIRADGIFIYDSAVQPNGKIVVTGAVVRQFSVGRLNVNGTLDATFGTNGVTITNFGLTQFSTGYSYAVALQADGKIVVSGNEDNNSTGGDYVLLARYNGTAAPVVNPTLRIFDFDGDGKADVSVFRSGIWYINPSTNPTAFAPQASYGVQFGQTGDVTVPADYDGDGKADIAVWRGGSLAYFYILNSSNNTFRSEQFGTAGDNPTVSGDWDADGKADLAVYRGAAQSFFYYRPSAQPGVNFVQIQWGTSGDTPIFGDFDGDRRLDATVYRPSNNTFYVRQSANGTLLARQWGNANTDAIFAGDFDGDGKSDFAVQRFSGADARTWYVAQSGGTTRAFQWGLATDLPVPADFDGDGKTDFAVFRRSNGTWYIYQSATNTVQSARFGAGSDFPLPLNLVR